MVALVTYRVFLRLTVIAVLVTATAPLQAAEKVFFDLPRTAACRDVTNEEFLASNPYERLVEARFQISSLVRHGGEEDLIQFFYRFDCRSPGAEIVEYLPQTTLASDISGTIGVQKITENARTLGLEVSGAFEHVVSGAGSGSVSSKNTTNVKYDMLPPLETVAASGTLNRRTAVYFKLKPTSQVSLEGGKEFVIILRVPRYWRGDLVQVYCQATGYRSTSAPPFEERGTVGGQRFLVALYLEGDEHAKNIAQQCATSEQRLRNLAIANRRAIEKQAFPTAAHRFGKILPVVEPKIPADWLERLVFGPPLKELEPYSERLPVEVLSAAHEFMDAKRALASLTRL